MRTLFDAVVFVALSLVALLATAQGAVVSYEFTAQAEPEVPPILTAYDSAAVWGIGGSSSTEASFLLGDKIYGFLSPLNSEQLFSYGANQPKWTYSDGEAPLTGAIVAAPYNVEVDYGVRLMLMPDPTQATNYQIFFEAENTAVYATLIDSESGDIVGETSAFQEYGSLNIMAYGAPVIVDLTKPSGPGLLVLGQVTANVQAVPEPGLLLGMAVMGVFAVLWYWAVLWVDRKIR